VVTTSARPRRVDWEAVVIEFERVRRREDLADSEPDTTAVAAPTSRLQVGSVDDPAERAADVAADRALAVLRAGDST
jgi:hypothetical protein